MGITTVAVYSEADANAMHVSMADEAVFLGPAPARVSYLVIEKILEAARRTDAEAVHPGYGFLSENATFAEACASAGIIFIGPPAKAIGAMGEKAAANALMQKAKVPVLPGYHEDNQEDEVLLRAADQIGYPVLIKAVSGGGGKGRSPASIHHSERIVYCLRSFFSASSHFPSRSGSVPAEGLGHPGGGGGGGLGRGGSLYMGPNWRGAGRGAAWLGWCGPAPGALPLPVQLAPGPPPPAHPRAL